MIFEVADKDRSMVERILDAYQIVYREELSCLRCHGSGEIATGLGTQSKACPSCRGGYPA